MCLSVHKETSNDSIDEFLGARPINKQLSGNDDDRESEKRIESEKVVATDMLAQSTQLTRKSFNLILAGARNIRKSNYYK